jgi:hypothetical protein
MARPSKPILAWRKDATVLDTHTHRGLSVHQCISQVNVTLGSAPMAVHSRGPYKLGPSERTDLPHLRGRTQ